MAGLAAAFNGLRPSWIDARSLMVSREALARRGRRHLFLVASPPSCRTLAPSPTQVYWPASRLNFWDHHTVFDVFFAMSFLIKIRLW